MAEWVQQKMCRENWATAVGRWAYRGLRLAHCQDWTHSRGPWMAEVWQELQQCTLHGPQSFNPAHSCAVFSVSLVFFFFLHAYISLMTPYHLQTTFPTIQLCLQSENKYTNHMQMIFAQQHFLHFSLRNIHGLFIGWWTSGIKHSFVNSFSDFFLMIFQSEILHQSIYRWLIIHLSFSQPIPLLHTA